MTKQTHGYLMGSVAIIIFGFTFPVTKSILDVFDPLFIAFGRASIGGVAALTYLAMKKKNMKRLTKIQFRDLSISAFGIVLIFPIFIAIALQYVDSSYAGVILAILPLVTAGLGSFIDKLAVPKIFWFWAVIGTLITMGYQILENSGEVKSGDFLILIAILFCAIGYVFGSKLSSSIGGVNTVSYSLVLFLPITMPMAIYTAPENFLSLDSDKILLLFFLGLLPQYIGFFFWYRGLSMGGTVRVSQVQLLQPFVTILVAYLFLNENITLGTILTALTIVVIVYLGKKSYTPKKIKRPA